MKYVSTGTEILEVRDEEISPTEHPFMLRVRGQRVAKAHIFDTREAVEAFRAEAIQQKEAPKPRQPYNGWDFGSLELGTRVEIPATRLMTCRNAARQYRRRHRETWNFKIFREADRCWLMRVPV